MVGPLTALAQSATMPAVGVLHLNAQEQSVLWTEAIKEGLTQHGLVDGKNLRLLIRNADDQPERLSGLASELARLGCRVIVTRGTTSVRAAQTGAPGVPIVMAGSADPVAMGFAQSLARPGGDITGISILGSELIGKHIEILKEMVPAARAFACFLQRANPGNAVFRRALEDAGAALGLRMHVREIEGADDIGPSFEWAAGLPVHGVFLLQDPIFIANRDSIARSASAFRLPTVSGSEIMAQAGVLVAYAFDLTAIARRSGFYVAEILRGASPGTLPIEQPTIFRLIINLQTARTLGITVPGSLLGRADEVIE